DQVSAVATLFNRLYFVSINVQPLSIEIDGTIRDAEPPRLCGEIDPTTVASLRHASSRVRRRALPAAPHPQRSIGSATGGTGSSLARVPYEASDELQRNLHDVGLQRVGMGMDR